MRSSAHDSASARLRPGQRARNLGQTGRGRDIVLASRTRLEGVGVAKSFLVSQLGWIGDRRFGVATKVFGSRQGRSVRGTDAGRDLEFGVATWKSHRGQKRGRDIKLMSRHRVASRRVATWLWCHDLDWPEWCRDTDLMSRHGSACLMEIGVATPFF